MKRSVMCFLFFCLLTIPSVLSLAQWTTDPSTNTPVIVAPGLQAAPATVSDGKGGVIIAWISYQGGSHIYVQRLDAKGLKQWTADGISLCPSSSTQDRPFITEDGDGGAIIAWQDTRNFNSDIYAQRIDSSGSILWTAAGVAVCTESHAQVSPRLTGDATGGAIIAWEDDRSGADIYAQRVNADGLVQWTGNGIVVCNATNTQFSTAVCSDAANGAIVAWQDNRNGNTDIAVQRVDSSGALLWTPGGVLICTESHTQQFPVIVGDGANGAIVAWWDLRGTGTDLYAQWIDGSGSVQWTPNGVAVATGTGDQNYPALLNDGVGDVVVAWQDARSGTGLDIYAQRINSAGTPQWGSPGAAVCTALHEQQSVVLVTDGSGGSIIAWSDRRNGTDADLYAQRLDAGGNPKWLTDGVVLSNATNNQVTPSIVSDLNGGAIVAFQDSREGLPLGDIYAQNVDLDGYLGYRIAITVNLLPKWNIVSLPVDAADPSVSTLFPTALTSAFSYQGGYVTETSLTTGEGYWVKFADAQIVSVRGYPLTFVRIPVETGWNLIGSLSDPIPVTSVGSSPPGIITSNFFEYNGHYDISTVIEPGKGYWVTVNQSGLLILSLPGQLPPSQRIRIVPDGQLPPAPPGAQAENSPAGVPKKYSLEQNYPNPFNPSTAVGYQLPAAGHVTLKVYDMLGEEIATLVDGDKGPGEYVVNWNAGGVASGIYFCRLSISGASDGSSPRFTSERRMLLVK